MKQVFHLYKSDKPNKKFMVITINPKTGRQKTVHFGLAGASDFLHHKDENRKALYIKRHFGMGEHWDDPMTAGFWSLHLLWNKKTMRQSITDTMKKFNIKILF